MFTVDAAGGSMVKRVTVAPDDSRDLSRVERLRQSPFLVIPFYTHPASYADVFLEHEIPWRRRLYLMTTPECMASARCELMYHAGTTSNEYLTGLGKPDLGAVLSIVFDACRGAIDLAAAGLIPIDLKCDNVMVTPDGRARIIDLEMLIPESPDLSCDFVLWELSHLAWGRPTEMFLAEGYPYRDVDPFAGRAFDVCPQVRGMARQMGFQEQYERIAADLDEFAGAVGDDSDGEAANAVIRSRWRALSSRYRCFPRFSSYVVGCLLLYLLVRPGRSGGPVAAVALARWSTQRTPDDGVVRCLRLALQCMSPDPARRPGLGDLASELAVLVASVPLPAPVLRPVEATMTTVATSPMQTYRDLPEIRGDDEAIEASIDVINTTCFHLMRWIRERISGAGICFPDDTWTVTRAVLFHVGALRYHGHGHHDAIPDDIPFHASAHTTAAACLVMSHLAVGGAARGTPVTPAGIREALGCGPGMTRGAIGTAMEKVVRAVRPHLRAILAANMNVSGHAAEEPNAMRQTGHVGGDGNDTDANPTTQA